LAVTDFLTDARIRSATPKGRPYKLRDGGGLYLLITPADARLWRLRYKVRGRESMLGHGPGVPSCAPRSKPAGIRQPSGAPSAPAAPICSRRSRASGSRSSRSRRKRSRSFATRLPPAGPSAIPRGSARRPGAHQSYKSRGCYHHISRDPSGLEADDLCQRSGSRLGSCKSGMLRNHSRRIMRLS